MHKVYIKQEDKAMRKVLNETYDELLAALKHRNPATKSLIEDKEYSQLHDLLALLRTGYIKVSTGENMNGFFTMIQINEGSKGFFDQR